MHPNRPTTSRHQDDSQTGDAKRISLQPKAFGKIFGKRFDVRHKCTFSVIGQYRIHTILCMEFKNAKFRMKID
jgi:hypothetical protein